MIEPKPTKRAVVDVGRKCQINCKFCYYSHLGDLRKQKYEATTMLVQEIDQAFDEGNNYIDFTGGEPTLHPDIEYLIEHALKHGMKSCIITNGLCGVDKAHSLINAGVDDFLVSVHGMNETHDELTQLKGAFDRQQKFLEAVQSRMRFRFNCVISRFSESQIFQLAEYFCSWNPSIVNYINMNPLQDWAHDTEGVKRVIADLDIVQPLLDKAIGTLEKNEIGVNVRYFPMCRVIEEHRRCVCNDLQVMFDPYEWSYKTTPKTFERYMQWGIETSRTNEQNDEPCKSCDLHNCCGGISKQWLRASEGKGIEAVRGHAVVPELMTDPFFYRRHNDMTLKERS